MFVLLLPALALEPWQVDKIAEADARIAAQPGGDLLTKTIAAHGGMAPWIEARTLAFDFDYAPLGDPGKRRYSRSRVDLEGRRAVQAELGEGADATLGWDGRQSWIVPTPESFPSDAGFWATTPFYFVGIPWVFADPGAVVTPLEAVVIPETGVDAPLPTLKVTYESGTGDAPDDFYILHLDPDDHRVLAVRYIVTYPAFFPDGGHSPEKILLWSDFQEADGMLFAQRYDSHLWKDGVGEKKVEVTVGNVEAGVAIDAAAFSPPPHPVGGVDHIGLAVSDLAASREFFMKVLGFRQRGQDESYPAYFLTNGTTSVTLWQTDADAREFDRRKSIGLHHLALSVESFEALDAMHERIAAWPGVDIEFSPEPLSGGPAKHMMFSEPSGNRLELIHRP